MNFRIGQRVVCVDASPDLYGRKQLTLNAVYTIRGFDTEGYGDDGSTFGVLLEEIPPEWGFDLDPDWEQELGFKPQRFRPIVEKKTDISIFTEMLKPKQRELISR